MKKLLFILVAFVAATFSSQAVKMSDLKIYINPGHGGYDSDDRNIQIYPYAYGDSMGYWESKSNLYKGLAMYHILDSLGTKAYLSRIKNRTEDDRDLYDIAYEANELGCDLFFSIHSNAGENVNYPIMLYRENAVGTPRYPESIKLSNILWDQLHSSKLSIWTRDERYVSGDLTFYPQWGNQGLGVLRRLYVPGLLSEGGMHEHRPEAHRLMNMDFCWLEAWHFVKSIMEFYDTEDRFVTGNVAGIVYDHHNTREETLEMRYTTFGRDKNKPLNGALVRLLDSTGKEVQKRTTDNDNNGVFVFRNVIPGEYTVVVTHDGYYESSSKVTVAANDVTYNDMPLVMKREMPLEIVEYTPKVAAGELVSCASEIVFKFNTDVDEESLKKAFTIEPAVDGEWIFSETYHVATFRPALAFATSTHYKVTVSTEAKTADRYYANANLQSPFTFEFDTKGRNRLELIQQYPNEGDAVHYASPTLEFRFDKAINASNIYDLITVADESGKTIGFNRRLSTYNKLSNGYGNVTLVLSSNLVVGGKYKVKLDKDIRDKEGIPLGEDVEIHFTAENQCQPFPGTVVEDFEGENVFEGNADASKDVNSTPLYTRYTTKRVMGNASGRFSYNFKNAKDGVAVWDYKGEYKAVKHGMSVSLYVFGDLNNHELSLGFTSGASTKYVKVCDVNFLGWRAFNVVLDEIPEDFEYTLSGVRLVQRNSLYAQKGGICIDNIICDVNIGVDETIADNAARVYPNPAAEVVNIEGIDSDATVEIYNLAGSLVKTAKGNTVEVKDLAQGVYILKSGTLVTRITIAR